MNSLDKGKLERKKMKEMDLEKHTHLMSSLKDGDNKIITIIHRFQMEFHMEIIRMEKTKCFTL